MINVKSDDTGRGWVFDSIPFNGGMIECCTTGALPYRSLMATPKFATLQTEHIENDSYWDRYNDTDKFEVIKV